MAKKTISCISIILALGLGLGTADNGLDVEYKPLSIAALQEFGSLRSGQFGTQTTQFQSEWVDHFGAFMTQEAVINQRLHLAVGLGGIFQFQKPEVVYDLWGGTQNKNFFIGPTRAEAVYSFGDTENPAVKLGLGMFPHKYNPDAANLGEYMFRSGPYPTVLYTGGYAVINNAAGYLQGLKSNLNFGNLKADVFLLTETTIAPLYDFTLACVLKYTIADGLVDLGAGVSFKRLLPIDGDTTRPEVPTNSYFDKGGVTYAGDPNYYSTQASFWDKKAQGAATPELAAQYQAAADNLNATSAAVRGWNNLPDGDAEKPDYQYYTARGTILMGRFSIDFKKLLDSDRFGKDDLKLFGEAAVLGVKDYPIYYENIMDRTPVMLGINLPGFRVLDLISFQVEQFKSPYSNSAIRVGLNNYPLPYLPPGSDELSSKDNYNDISANDNLSWSLLLKKELTPGISIFAQCARDHLRLVSESFYFGPALDAFEILRTEDDWYWMLQIAWGI